MSWTSDQARALADRILSFSKARECEVSLRLSEDRAHPVRRQRHHDRRHGPERLGRDHQPRGRQERLDHDRRARRLAAPRGGGPERGPDGRGAARPGAGRGPRPAGLSRDPRVRRRHRGRRPGPSAATASRRPSTAPADEGSTPRASSRHGARWLAIANKKGNFGFHRATVAEYSTTMRTADGTGSGYARFGSPRLSDIDAGRARRARGEQGRVVGKAARPAAGRVHRDPRARGGRRPADVPALLAERPHRRRGAQLPLEARRRQPARREALRRRRDPALRPVQPAAIPATPWAGGGGRFGGRGGGSGGLPARKTTWIENGVVKTLAVDRYWAKKTKVEPVPLSGGLILEGSDKSLEALIAETERALLVTRFWYIRSVNPQNAMVTGLTRDGVWLSRRARSFTRSTTSGSTTARSTCSRTSRRRACPSAPAAASSPR